MYIVYSFSFTVVINQYVDQMNGTCQCSMYQCKVLLCTTSANN